MFSKKAYTLIEVSIALFILNLSLVIWLNIFKSLSFFDSKIVERQNTIGLIQLRRMLSIGKDFEIEGFELCMNFRDRETCFYETNNHLIQTPGTQIYLIEVSDVSFYEQDDIFYMNYYQNDHYIETVIGYR